MAAVVVGVREYKYARKRVREYASSRPRQYIRVPMHLCGPVVPAVVPAVGGVGVLVAAIGPNKNSPSSLTNGDRRASDR